MEVILTGFAQAATPVNLLFCFLGVLAGTLVGVLPGLGPTAAIALLLPLSYSINDPLTSIIFLAGIYYGTQYGGSTTAILLRLPGENSSLVTIIDGYEMTRRGRAGAALSIAALSSFFAGTVATILIAFAAQPLSLIAFEFGPQEYATMMLTGLLASVAIASGSMVRGLIMILIGALLGLVGTDVNTGTLRFTAGILELHDGISFGIMAMGIFGLGEIVWNLVHESSAEKPAAIKFRELYPTRQEFKQAVPPTVRGTIVGSLLGLLPGGGASISSFFSYAIEKKISRNPTQFGQGAVAGVAGPESANNAGAQTGFIPMLSLGIPTNSVMALIIAALMINDIQPGPTVISNNPTLFWGLIASMWIGNLMLLILNLPLVGIWVKFLQIPRSLMFSAIIATCIYGTYSINHNWFDVWMLIPFALIGYSMKWLGFDLTPLALGFVIAPMAEEHLRRSLTISRGDWSTFVASPISLGFVMISLIAITIKIYTSLRKP
jgi:TctA family transporter